MKNKKYLNIILLISIILIGILGYRMFNKPPVQTTSTTTKLTSITYHNTQYGFDFKLPLTWDNYPIVSSKWTGISLDESNSINYDGPKISIRHPLWTSENTRQDIPIMIFTLAQWDLIQQEKISVSAAPIGPSKLGQNSKYIFALPARYNFAYETGWEEVETIIKTNPLQGF